MAGRTGNQARAGRNIGANQTADILFFRFTGHDFAGENRFRLRAGSIDLQSLRARPDQGVVVRDFAFTGSGGSAGCHVFDRRGRLRANGLDLSRVRKLPGSYSRTRSQRREPSVRNSRLETSAPDVGAFCRAKVRFELVQGYPSHLERRTGKSAQPKESAMSNEKIFATPRKVEDVADCYFYHTMELPGHGLIEGRDWDFRADPLRIVEQCAKRAKSLIIVDKFHSDLEGAPVSRLAPTPENFLWHTWWHFSTQFFTQFVAVMGFTTSQPETHQQLHRGRAHTLFTLVGRRE